MTPTPGAIRAAERIPCPMADEAYVASIIDAENESLLIAARGILHVLTHDVAPETVSAAVALLKRELGE